MKKLGNITLAIGLICLAVSIVSRFTMRPITGIAPGGLDARAILAFANTCFLLTIILFIIGKCKSK